MATDHQLNANRKNAQNSTGPRSESGKAVSARNALTLGLFTQTDYVRPEEQSEYNDLCARCVTELNPQGVLEETFVIAIVTARWRMRRCALVERQFARDTHRDDPMYDPYRGDYQASVDRARSRAFNLLCRSTTELRRLQTDRAVATKLLPEEIGLPTLASAKQLVTVINQHRRVQHKPVQSHTAVLASNCAGSQLVRPYPLDDPAQTPRSGRCPCGSGEKFKRCCGKDAPPVLGPAGKSAQLARPYPHKSGTKPQNPGQKAA